MTDQFTQIFSIARNKNMLIKEALEGDDSRR